MGRCATTSTQGNQTDFKILDFLWFFEWVIPGPSCSSADLCCVGCRGGLCRLCIFQGVGEEPTLSNEAIHNMDGYDKCILVSGHKNRNGKAYRTHYGLLKGRFSSLAHSAMGCSMRWYDRFCSPRGSNGAVGCCRCALLHIVRHHGKVVERFTVCFGLRKMGRKQRGWGIWRERSEETWRVLIIYLYTYIITCMFF